MSQPGKRNTNRSEIIMANLMSKWSKRKYRTLLEGWARDGYTNKEIAQKMLINDKQFQQLLDGSEAIRKALDHGKEMTDYSVEKALLKSALGYKKKEVKITSIIRYGKLVETQKEELTTDVAPNVQAAQTWLYNRRPDKWKRDPQKGVFDDIDEDTSIKIEVTRVGSSDSEPDEEWQKEVNKEVKVRKATKEEQEQAEKEKNERIQEELKNQEELQENEQLDSSLDDWPENWEEMIEDD